MGLELRLSVAPTLHSLNPYGLIDGAAGVPVVTSVRKHPVCLSLFNDDR